MAQDEGRFGRIDNIQKSWCPKSIRPLAPKQIIREYFYVYSAVCPELGDLLSLILPYANVECMMIFLDYISKKYINKNIIMQVDGASWHTTKKLVLPAIYF
jgi:hypothetical protein